MQPCLPRQSPACVGCLFPPDRSSDRDLPRTRLGDATTVPATRSEQVLGLATELASGLLFAGGLVVSGMVRPSKVVAFLSALHPAW